MSSVSRLCPGYECGRSDSTWITPGCPIAAGSRIELGPSALITIDTGCQVAKPCSHVGIDDTGVRAGIIGEIGTSDPLHPREEKVLRAAALAQAHTGAAITLHLTPPTRNAHATLDILEEAGADLGRVVVGHLDESIDETLDYHRSIADRGCYLEYDDCGYEMYFPRLANGAPHFWLPSDRDRARAVVRLCEAGYADRILLSHDVCNKTYLLAYGGFGYGHILRNLVTNIRDFGASEQDIDTILRANPQRMLALG